MSRIQKHIVDLFMQYPAAAPRYKLHVTVLFSASNAGYGVKVSPRDAAHLEASLFDYWKKRRHW